MEAESEEERESDGSGSDESLLTHSNVNLKSLND